MSLYVKYYNQMMEADAFKDHKKLENAMEKADDDYLTGKDIEPIELQDLFEIYFYTCSKHMWEPEWNKKQTPGN